MRSGIRSAGLVAHRGVLWHLRRGDECRRAIPRAVPPGEPRSQSLPIRHRVPAPCRHQPRGHRALGITGPTCTVSSNCCTGLDAIGLGHAHIASGLADIASAGGCEAPISPLVVSAFSALKALSTRNDAPARASRPYDRDRDGLVLGEGGGAAVLEALDSARRRGAAPYAEVGGHAA